MVGQVMLMLKKRGQAAMEYMTTYGWAIVVVLLVFVTLWWLGVFNVSQSDRCLVNPAFNCQNFKATPDDVSLSLRNNGANDMAVCDIICDGRKPGQGEILPGGSSYPNCENEGTRIISAGTKTVRASDNVDGSSVCTYNGADALEVGEVYKGKLYIVYNEIGEGGNPRIVTGDIYATVQP